MANGSDGNRSISPAPNLKAAQLGQNESGSVGNGQTVDLLASYRDSRYGMRHFYRTSPFDAMGPFLTAAERYTESSAAARRRAV